MVKLKHAKEPIVIRIMVLVKLLRLVLENFVVRHKHVKELNAINIMV